MIHYFRRGSTTSPLRVSEIYNYYYPDANTKIEVIYEEDGELDDSIVYVFEGSLLIEERHLSDTIEWGKRFEYNQDGKLQKTINLETGNVTENYFDESGMLEKSLIITGEEVHSVLTYEREINGNQLMIRCYVKNSRVNTVEPFLSSHKKFVNRKLVEYVRYHPTFPGSEWFCTKYEYY
jgi:antitoxin component YwqK of YwqJK toxin-antitoxin module